MKWKSHSKVKALSAWLLGFIFKGQDIRTFICHTRVMLVIIGFYFEFAVADRMSKVNAF